MPNWLIGCCSSHWQWGHTRSLGNSFIVRGDTKRNALAVQKPVEAGFCWCVFLDMPLIHHDMAGFFGGFAIGQPGDSLRLKVS